MAASPADFEVQETPSPQGDCQDPMGRKHSPWTAQRLKKKTKVSSPLYFSSLEECEETYEGKASGESGEKTFASVVIQPTTAQNQRLDSDAPATPSVRPPKKGSPRGSGASGHSTAQCPAGPTPQSRHPDSLSEAKSSVGRGSETKSQSAGRRRSWNLAKEGDARPDMGALLDALCFGTSPAASSLAILDSEDISKMTPTTEEVHEGSPPKKVKTGKTFDLTPVMNMGSLQTALEDSCQKDLSGKFDPTACTPPVLTQVFPPNCGSAPPMTHTPDHDEMEPYSLSKAPLSISPEEISPQQDLEEADTKVAAYNAELLVAAKDGDIDKTCELWQEMREAEVLPTLRTLNTILLCCYHGGANPMEVLQLAKEICEMGKIKPDATTRYHLTAIDTCWQQLQYADNADSSDDEGDRFVTP